MLARRPRLLSSSHHMMDDVEIVPCAAADLGSRPLVLTIAFVLPTPCADVAALRDALFAAIREKMPKAGARLVKRDKVRRPLSIPVTLNVWQVFEFHVPHTFSDQTPPCAFTTSTVSSTLAVKLPPASNGIAEPCFLRDEPIAKLFRGPGCPRSFEGFMKPNVPVTHVHVAVYKDATLIGFTTTHVAFDAHGAKLLLAAWAAATRGELDEIEASPASFVPLSAEATRERTPKDVVLPPAQPRRGWYALNKAGAMRFISRFAMRIARDPKLAHILIRVPKPWLDEEKRKAMVGLKDGDYVSTNDVLSAWIFKVRSFHASCPF